VEVREVLELLLVDVVENLGDADDALEVDADGVVAEFVGVSRRRQREVLVFVDLLRQNGVSRTCDALRCPARRRGSWGQSILQRCPGDAKGFLLRLPADEQEQAAAEKDDARADTDL